MCFKWCFVFLLLFLFFVFLTFKPYSLFFGFFFKGDISTILLDCMEDTLDEFRRAKW